MNATTMTTNRCACGRDYYTENVGENGKCCICNRDERMVALLGNDWRSILVGSVGVCVSEKTNRGDTT